MLCEFHLHVRKEDDWEGITRGVEHRLPDVGKMMPKMIEPLSLYVNEGNKPSWNAVVWIKHYKIFKFLAKEGCSENSFLPTSFGPHRD